MSPLIPQSPPTTGSSFHLITESFSAEDPTSEPLEIQSGVSEILGESARIDLTTEFNPESKGVFLEPVLGESKPQLLLIDRGDHGIRVNDQRMGGIALLNAGDQFKIGVGPAIEVSLFHRVMIGAPTREQVGKQCPVCLCAIEEDARVLSCPCGAVIHMEEEGEDPLECALSISDCPVCGQSLTLTEGYITQPEFLK